MGVTILFLHKLGHFDVSMKQNHMRAIRKLPVSLPLRYFSAKKDAKQPLHQTPTGELFIMDMDFLLEPKKVADQPRLSPTYNPRLLP